MLWSGEAWWGVHMDRLAARPISSKNFNMVATEVSEMRVKYLTIGGIGQVRYSLPGDLL